MPELSMTIGADKVESLKTLLAWVSETATKVPLKGDAAKARFLLEKLFASRANEPRPGGGSRYTSTQVKAHHELGDEVTAKVLENSRVTESVHELVKGIAKNQALKLESISSVAAHPRKKFDSGSGIGQLRGLVESRGGVEILTEKCLLEMATEIEALHQLRNDDGR